MHALATPVMANARRADLDNLKIALTALVIVHHLAISFGAAGSWYFVDPRAPSSLGLSVFTALNQSFFMGLFFFVSGYFAPGSLDRKGGRQFIVERTWRLLVPMVVFGLVLAPCLEYAKRTSLGLSTPRFSAYYFARIADWREFDTGPLWFVWALWLVSVGYAAVRALRPPPAPPTPLGASDLAVLAVALAIGIASFVVRMIAPIGLNVVHIQLAYVPQYLVMFAVGVACGRRSLQPLGRERFVRWLGGAIAAVGASAFVFAVVAHGDSARLRGG